MILRTTGVSQAELEWVRSRTRLPFGEAQELPILLDGDDFDFAGGCVIVEVTAGSDVVRWRRFRYNDTEFSPERTPLRYIGGPVAWFAEPQPRLRS
jgi:hypothetical protein